jgi:hypothetical protein
VFHNLVPTSCNAATEAAEPSREQPAARAIGRSSAHLLLFRTLDEVQDLLADGARERHPYLPPLDRRLLDDSANR